LHSSSKAAKRAKISDTLGAIDYNSEEARKIKDKFRVAIASVIVQHLGPYRKDTCEIGKITNNEDFKHLARKVGSMKKKLLKRFRISSILSVFT
jgi:[histone H3]-lysine36 N-trimethyltransferase